MGETIRLAECRDHRVSWSQSELGEFYRVGAILRNAGWSLEIDSGWTDEGDPWLVFCECRTGEVISHFAKIKGNYLLDAAPLRQPLSGENFATLLNRFVSIYASIDHGRRSSIYSDPLVSLVIVLATIWALGDQSTLAQKIEIALSSLDTKEGLDAVDRPLGVTASTDQLSQAAISDVLNVRLNSSQSVGDRQQQSSSSVPNPLAVALMLVAGAQLLPNTVGESSAATIFDPAIKSESSVDRRVSELEFDAVQNVKFLDRSFHDSSADDATVGAELSPGAAEQADTQVCVNDKLPTNLAAELAALLASMISLNGFAFAKADLQLDGSETIAKLMLAPGDDWHLNDSLNKTPGDVASSLQAASSHQSLVAVALPIEHPVDTPANASGQPAANSASPATNLTHEDSFIRSFMSQISGSADAWESLFAEQMPTQELVASAQLTPQASQTLSIAPLTPPLSDAAPVVDNLPALSAPVQQTFQFDGHHVSLLVVDHPEFNQAALTTVVTSFLQLSGSYTILQDGVSYYFIDNDVLGLEAHQDQVVMDQLETQNSTNIYLVGIAETLHDMSAIIAGHA